MSEAEKTRRKEYRQSRKRWIMIFTFILCGLVVLSTAFGIVFRVLDNTLYVSYQDRSSVDYQVKLFPNDYFEGEWQPSGQSYVAEITDKLKADFQYAVNVDEDGAAYRYSYDIKTTLFVVDKLSLLPIYHPVEVTKALTEVHTSGDDTLKETVLIDYAAYRAEALAFIDQYGLKTADAYISLRLHVDIWGSSDCATASGHDITLKLPLVEQTFRPETSATVPTGEIKYLECEAGVAVTVFQILTIVFGTLTVLLGIFLLAFIYFTRNHDINYAIRVKRLISAYRSFIQEITAPFDTEGYRVVRLKTFNEMLEVRDTVNSPLLMYANEDGTATTFVIPTCMGLLYSFEIRVEDYNEIYGITEEAAEVEVETEIEIETAIETEAEENVEAPAADVSSAEETKKEETEE